MSHPFEIDLATLVKYDKPGPRYTSYPTAPMWSDAFREPEYLAALKAFQNADVKPVSMYVHVPFCEAMCTFCGCAVIVSKRREQGDEYLDRLEREVELTAAALGPGKEVVQLHYGGGTPTFLTVPQLERLCRIMTRTFTIAPGAELSVEVDPCVTRHEHMEILAACGFNRVSMGVQDFDLRVQEAVNRSQPVDMTARLIQDCRALGFVSVNLDLIYGLPYQTPETFAATCKEIAALRPDRMACYSYAHVPWLRPHQRKIPEDALPLGAAKVLLFKTALEIFVAGGYVPVGMDHFALATDELARAFDTGRVHRNFMGYTVQPAEDMVSFGLTAISEVSGCFAQAEKKLSDYYRALDSGHLPIARGLCRSAEDERRRYVINRIMCDGALSYAAFAARFGEPFSARYGELLPKLRPFEDDGLLVASADGFTITPKGRLLVRNVCMIFDAYLGSPPPRGKLPVYSRTL